MAISTELQRAVLDEMNAWSREYAQSAWSDYYDFYARDPQAMGDDAGVEPVPTDATWLWYCKRCADTLAQGYDFCTPCTQDFWAEAESYGLTGQALNARVMSIRARWVAQ